jgi:uncharacterized membrane protein
MSVWFEFLRWAHVLGATVLLGTGVGIAFFMLMAHRTKEPTIIAHVARTVVIADAAFTATAVVIQPITGVLLAQASGWPLTTPWLILSVALYLGTGLCWLPVVWIQWRIRNLATASAAAATPLPASYERLLRAWVLLGIPAFIFVLAIVWLMVTRPTF